MNNLISVEVRWRYDWTAYRQDKDWNKFSRYARVPIQDDELCKSWWIYKVIATWPYEYKVISKREDKKRPSEEEEKPWVDMHMCYSCRKPVHHDQMYFWHWDPICDLCREW